MMNWVGVALLIPVLMCAAMMLGGAALAVFGFRQAGEVARDRDRPDGTRSRAGIAGDGSGHVSVPDSGLRQVDASSEGRQ